MCFHSISDTLLIVKLKLPPQSEAYLPSYSLGLVVPTLVLIDMQAHTS